MTTQYFGNSDITQFNSLQGAIVRIQGEAGDDRIVSSGLGTEFLQRLTQTCDVRQRGGNLTLNQIIAPVDCVAALAGAAGAVDNGDHDYIITFSTAGLEETEGGTPSNTVTVANNAVDGQINLTAIPVSTNNAVIRRIIYRRFNGAGTYKTVTTIGDNSTTTYTDNTANAGLGGELGLNTTGALIARGPIDFNNGISVQRTESAAGDHTITTADYIIGKSGITGGGDSIFLPLASNTPSGRVIIVKDESGGAAANNITIVPSGADTIDGAASYPITTNYGSATLYTDSVAWFVI